MGGVTRNSVEKVEKYLVQYSMENGTKELKLKVDQISFGAGVALATAHRAIKALADEGVIQMSGERAVGIQTYTGWPVTWR